MHHHQHSGGNMFGWLFRTKVIIPETKLEAFLKNIRDPNDLQTSVSKHLGKPTMGFATASSLVVMASADRFAVSLRDNVIENRKSVGTTALPLDALYDRAVLESTAFTHFLLMREYLMMGDYDSAEDDAPDKHQEGLRDAAELSGWLLADYFTPPLPKEIVLKRMMNYGTVRKGPDALREAAGRFERILANSLLSEGISLKVPADRMGGMDVELAVKLQSGLHCKWFLEAIEPLVNQLALQCRDMKSE
jgi:hypothetical protein